MRAFAVFLGAGGITTSLKVGVSGGIRRHWVYAAAIVGAGIVAVIHGTTPVAHVY